MAAHIWFGLHRTIFTLQYLQLKIRYVVIFSLPFHMTIFIYICYQLEYILSTRCASIYFDHSGYL